MQTPGTQEAAPRTWWREPMMWLVVGGPGAVILAGVATVALAVAHPDPVVDADYYRKGVEINRTLAERAAETPGARRPAMEGRNHAATVGRGAE
ncbi:MAG TPA: FixH family protein [Burkholderiaceae bacterium]|nr:FixH family protein [Burkholderiaceae bacterium]